MALTKRKAKAYLAFLVMKVAKGILASKICAGSEWYTQNLQRRSLVKVKAYEEKFEKKSMLPESLEIELTNRCNLHCMFCPNGSHRRKRGAMTLETFKRIVDGIDGNGITKVIISGFGECLLDKGIIEKLDYLKKKTERVTRSVELVTNGTLLTEYISENLVEGALVNKINVSIDAGDHETYMRIHGRGEFEKIIRNIRYLQTLKITKGLLTPMISVRFKDFYANHGQYGTFVRRLSEVADEIKPYANIFEWPESNLQIGLIGMDGAVRMACPNIWMAMRINWNGDVVLCCQDYEGSLVLGNTNSETLIKIWNKQLIRSYRASHKRLRFKGLKMCDKCNINTHWVIPW